MTLRDWIAVIEPEPPYKTKEALARAVLGVSRQTLDAWLDGKYAPKPYRRTMLSWRTGRCVPVEEFARMARERIDSSLTK